MDAPEPQDSERAEHHLPRAMGAARRRLVKSNQKVPDPIVDVVVDRPTGRMPNPK
jgi:hypothetical protein